MSLWRCRDSARLRRAVRLIINQPLDRVEAGPADHLVPHVDLNVPLPLGVGDAEERGRRRPTPRTDIRVLDEGDAPLRFSALPSAA